MGVAERVDNVPVRGSQNLRHSGQTPDCRFACGAHRPTHQRLLFFVDAVQIPASEHVARAGRQLHRLQLRANRAQRLQLAETGTERRKHDTRQRDRVAALTHRLLRLFAIQALHAGRVAGAGRDAGAGAGRGRAIRNAAPLKVTPQTRAVWTRVQAIRSGAARLVETIKSPVHGQTKAEQAAFKKILAWAHEIIAMPDPDMTA